MPLDLEKQAEYRANRDMITIKPAFKKMQEDAANGRTFSNIVAEYNKKFEPEKPLKIIGGQHRFQAIMEALGKGVDKRHGIKLYFDLPKSQRLDVQLISNTAIAVSPDLYDRMQETMRGPELRDWCQSVGLLKKGQDFADKHQRGGRISVQLARLFILNYYLGKSLNSKSFPSSALIPTVPKKGGEAVEWENLLNMHPEFYNDEGLKEAAKEFAALAKAQRDYKGTTTRKADDKEKAFNIAVMSAWAFIAGVLQSNGKRLKRHFSLKSKKGGDPLRSNTLATGKHRTDPDNYRGLGYRTDAKERGRFAELFFYQAENGSGISVKSVKVAIANFHAKQANIEAEDAKNA